jgi:multidrug resistance efflux pump
MFRWLAVCLILCVGTVLLMNMALSEQGVNFYSLFQTAKAEDPPNSKDPVSAQKPGRTVDKSEISWAPGAGRTNNVVPPLVIHEARIQVVDKQDAASEHDGILLFFGTEIRQTEAASLLSDPSKRKQDGKIIEDAIGYLVVQEDDPKSVPADQLLVFRDAPDKKYRYRRPGESMDPDKVRVALMPHLFRKLEVGDRVEKGDLLAMVKPSMALDDLEMKVASYRAAEADRRASEKTRDEAHARYDGMTNSRLRVKGSVSDDEYRGAKLTWERYIEEEKSKTGAREKAERELNGSMTQLRMHEIRAMCSGVVKVIYKNRGDAVKNLEPVLHIENPDHLRVEGVAEVQDTQNLARGMPVWVEPTQLESPRSQLRGHTQEVTCVAVGREPKKLILSGSEDRSLRIWDSASGQELGAFVHPTAVRSVACTGEKASHNLALVGTADGTVRVFDLDKLDSFQFTDDSWAPLLAAKVPEAVVAKLKVLKYKEFERPAFVAELAKILDKETLDKFQSEMLKRAEVKCWKDCGQAHQSSVTSVAFSPDGKFCLTAGEDRLVVVWRVRSPETGAIDPKQIHTLPAAHRSAVTSVQFIPPPIGASDKVGAPGVQFLTVGQDQTALVWTMEEEKEPVVTMEFDQRSDAVPVLSTDGQRVLIDQAGELRLRSLKDRTRIEGRLRNPPGTAGFTTLALFAPDGNTILTNIASEGRVQLWRKPPPFGRGSELRQMMWNSGAATCAAFSPDSTFVVTGTKDQQVLIWKMPGKDEIDTRLMARISLIEKSPDSSSRQVRIWADLDNPPSWVRVGGTATMVIPQDNPRIPPAH